jgi:protein O-mannosyl-transferase
MRKRPPKNRPPDRDNPAPLPTEPDTRQHDARMAAAVCLFLLLAVMLVFGQTLWHGFVNIDDQDYVFRNSDVKGGLTLRGIEWAFTTKHAANWHPLTWLSHMLDCQIYGPPADTGPDSETAENQLCDHYARFAWGHHLTSVLLHAATAISLFLVLWRMTGALWLAAFVAAVFAVHPLRVESVAWVAERKDVLSGLFFVLTLAAYVAYVRRPFSLGRYLAVVVLFGLGLMAKPMLVTLPLVLLLLDYWPLGRFSRLGGTDIPVCADRSGSLGRHKCLPHPIQGCSRQMPVWRLIVEKLPLLAVSAGSCAVTLWAQSKAIASFERVDFPSRLANAVVSYLDYLAQLFCPINLAPLYPHPLDELVVWRIALAALVLAAISIAAVVVWRRCPYVLVGWFWFLGMLVPVIGLVQVGSQARADRYTYLPQIGPCIAIAWLAAGLAVSWPRQGRLLCRGVAAIILLDLIVCGAQQTWYWHDNKTLWTHTLECTTKNATAHYGLACALSELHQDDDAIAEFEKALVIKANFPEASFNLASALKRRGKIDAAIEQYRLATAGQPDLVDAHYNLGVLLTDRGKFDEAIAEFRSTLAYKPDHANACYSLAVCLSNRGKFAEAMPYWREAVRLEPNNADTVEQAAWRLATCPDASLRDGPKALELAERAVRLAERDDPLPLGTLAAAYAEVGRFSEAVQSVQQAIALAVRQGNMVTDSASRAQIEATADALRAQLELYRGNRPYHERPGQPR